MQGQRLPNGFTGTPPRGAYWRDERGWWTCCSPNGRIGLLTEHQVVEHEDGTITVTPSIQVDPLSRATTAALPGWHGFLERGVWREC